MGPEIMAGLAAAASFAAEAAPVITAAGTVAGAAGTLVSASGQAQSAMDEAAAEEQRTIAEGQIAARKALEERAAAQRTAGDEMHKAKLTQSRLGNIAGASGAGASDQTIIDLYGDIEQEGRYNAAAAMAAGDQRAQGLTYQAALDRWRTDANNRIKRAGARSTLIGGILGAGGQIGSAMSRRYSDGNRSVGSGGSTGYAR